MGGRACVHLPASTTMPPLLLHSRSPWLTRAHAFIVPLPPLLALRPPVRFFEMLFDWIAEVALRCFELCVCHCGFTQPVTTTTRARSAFLLLCCIVRTPTQMPTVSTRKRDRRRPPRGISSETPLKRSQEDYGQQQRRYDYWGDDGSDTDLAYANLRQTTSNEAMESEWVLDEGLRRGAPRNCSNRMNRVEYYSPFQMPPDQFVPPNAIADPMSTAASTTSVNGDPGRGFLNWIRQVFKRPRTDINETPLPEDLNEEWINVLYYEYSERVGPIYRSSAAEVIVDCHYEKSSNFRFSMGNLNNPHRTPLIRRIRNFIRDGIRIYNRNGNVLLSCLSELPIFVQSPLLAHKCSEHLGTVYRLAPGQTIPIFMSTHFDSLIFTAMRQGHEAIGFLRQVCTVRISFNKGWGEDYNSQTVLETPIWIEVIFTAALAELELLREQFRRVPSLPAAAVESSSSIS